MNTIFDVITRPWFSDFDRLEDTNSENWNWVRGKKTIPTGDQNFTFAHNTRTGDFFWEDSASLVALKCSFILIGNPIHGAGRALFYTAKAPFEFLRVFYQYTNQFIDDLKIQSFCQSFYENFKNSIIDLTTSIASDLWNVVRVPFYCLGYELAAIEGMISDPYRARVKIGQIEKDWNHGIHRHFTPCHQWPADPFNAGFSKLWEGIKRTESFYLAFCMQCQGNINDTVGEGENQRPKFTIIEQEGDPKDLTRTTAHKPAEENVPCCPLNRLCYY